ncbi:uncharacterized protein LOC125165885 [Prionailurus viverrinus]|uniref:uncharacterized protein LOC125165885 n=1 Tax=Prionailurus viverrinus TaxID=61388 RepID=UPI001FF6A6F9|nr:uncharacterized protein LOC125165885 [Prionailurus viverrinus]XP_047715291.1 uncharacterized protein LOC125165885 [Prionailurus viverrinus]XP_047715292.1 uncharacterized protein LOC125165885 [Prionailurus viverrinus]XP_047715293.1 uncharacterized protein LOC125165885 [Prionailurus viverrinus]XP_047715294.1 uncharacterized protein LOC125165885 [Prionailurus viverrinus]
MCTRHQTRLCHSAVCFPHGKWLNQFFIHRSMWLHHQSQIAQSENKELFDNALEKRVKGWFRTNSRKNDPVPAWRRTHELNPVGLWDLGRKFFNYWWSTKTRKQMILLANRRKISSSLTLCHNAYVIHLISSRHVNILSPIITRRGDELFTALRPGRKKSGRRTKERLHEMKAQADWRCHLLEDNSILFITTSLFMFVGTSKPAWKNEGPHHQAETKRSNQEKCVLCWKLRKTPGRCVLLWGAPSGCFRGLMFSWLALRHHRK